MTGAAKPVGRKRFAWLVLTLMALLVAAPAARADVDDFVFEEFSGSYQIGIDDRGRATLEVTEDLVALFPAYNQNRGILRYLPQWYRGLPLQTDLIAAAGSDERTLADSYPEGDAFLVQLAVPEDEFVTGVQSYNLKYRQLDVVGYVDPSNVDGYQEFYWDINGTGWAQPFGNVSAYISLDPALWDAALPETFSCYQGGQGDTTECEIAPTRLGNGVGFLVQANNLTPGETITVALAFAPNTFVMPTRDYWQSIWPWLQLSSASLAILLFGVALQFRLRHLRSAPGRPAIIAEYQPPKGLSLSTAAALMQKLDALPSAMLLQLAVSGEARLLQGAKKKWALELVDGELGATEGEFFQVLFARTPVAGEAFDLGKPSAKRVGRITKYAEQLNQQLRTDSLVTQPRLGQRLLLGAGALFAMAGSATFGLLALIDHYSAGTLVLLMIGGFIFGTTAGLLMVARPLTTAGAELRDALKGLVVYIKLAEADRLNFLQSPSGAERRVSERGEVLKLYEGLLPWAVLFGLGKQWAQTLEGYYGDDTPVWLAGAAGLSFHSSLDNFTAGANSSFASSSGGSSGGGSSGGGGGGGGGGGI